MIAALKHFIARPWVSKTGTGLLVFVSGAYVATAYLEWRLNGDVAEVGQLRSTLELLWWVTLLINSLVQPRRTEPRYLPDISPAKSGAIVVLATGVAAAIALGWDFQEAADLILPGLVVVLALGIAWIVARYASRHGDQIGEVRFGVRDRDPAG
jgi:hypothetical protein